MEISLRGGTGKRREIGNGRTASGPSPAGGPLLVYAPMVGCSRFSSRTWPENRHARDLTSRRPAHCLKIGKSSALQAHRRATPVGLACSPHVLVGWRQCNAIRRHGRAEEPPCRPDETRPAVPGPIADQLLSGGSRQLRTWVFSGQAIASSDEARKWPFRLIVRLRS